MISPPRDIFSDALRVPAPKPPRAPVVDRFVSAGERKLSEALTQAAASKEMTPDERRTEILVALSNASSLKAGQIGKAIGVASSSVSNVIKNQVQSGFVTAKKCTYLSLQWSEYSITEKGLIKIGKLDGSVVKPKKTQAENILAYVAANPMKLASHIAKGMGVSATCANKYLRGLHAAQLVEAGGKNRDRAVLHRITEAGIAKLEALK